LRYILETTAEMSPNVTREKEKDGDDVGDDLEIDLDDNEYTHPSQDDDAF
jgi:hypothetical protein